MKCSKQKIHQGFFPKSQIVFKTILTLLFFSSSLSAQVFYGSGGSIPDTSSIGFSTTISGLAPSSIDTVSFGLEKVCINLTHTWMGDLQISLIAPDGTWISLTKNNGSDGDGFINTCFTSAADTSVIIGTPPYSGEYRPQEQLGIINNGQNGNGVWQLYCKDIGPSDTGSVLDWSITFGPNPEKAKIFHSSDLPLVLINTHGQDIKDTPKIIADMGIIDNGPGSRNNITDPFNNYDNKIGIELRGASSLYFAQSSYSVETKDDSLNNLNASLLSMPAEHDWILYAPFQDKSLLRNVLTYKLSRDMGHYASRTKYCEVLIDNKYQGLYVLMEKIKIDKHRVNISNLQVKDTIGDELTGGYIIKIDWVNGGGGDGWKSNYSPYLDLGDSIYFQYDYPKGDILRVKQKNYIHAYVDSFETALAGPSFSDPANGYLKYIDRSSFIDFLIINELGRSVDAYRASTYLYKEKDSKGGKLFMGPVWDYNYAWDNADFCSADSSQGWQYIEPYCSPKPFWWNRFMQDTVFVNAVQCRWKDLRTTVLDITNINNTIDSIVILTNEARARHFDQWPIFGKYMFNPISKDFGEEITTLKNWISERILWIDDNLPGNCSVTEIAKNNYQDFELSVYPNPFNNHVSIKYTLKNEGEVKIKLFDLMGKEVRTLVNDFQSQKNYTVEWDGKASNGSALPADIYICMIHVNGNLVERTKLVKY